MSIGYCLSKSSYVNNLLSPAVQYLSDCLAFMSPSQEAEQQPADNVPCHMEVWLAKETLILDSNSQTIGNTRSIPAARTIVADEDSANLVVRKRGETEEAHGSTVFMLAISLGYFPDCQKISPRIHWNLGFNATVNE